MSVFFARLDPSAGGVGLIAIREGLRGWLCNVGLVEPGLHRLLIAVGEACSNVVEHSGAGDDGAQLAGWIRASCARGRVRVVIADRGCWKTPVLDGPAGRGWGRSMMTGLVDHAEVHPGPNGTTVELIEELR